ncbi:MAG: hypothetical protein NWF09_05265 [Candidatus Bathyarchaeota archaeon]|nr:hypothetical protein [Candidatus Bathyarchaeota archaeon]
MKLPNWLRNLLHLLGLALLGGTVALQAIVFSDIVMKGKFIGYENNPLVLAAEAPLTVYAAVYYSHFYLNYIRKQK